jgi:DNA repair protein RecO (recombination protein O)
MANPQTTRGFIVARMPYGNTSLIIRCLCKQAGRLTLMAKGAARPKSPFAGALDLFYLADFHYQPSRTGDMHTLLEVKLVEAHLGLRRSYANLVAAQYFAALIETVTESGTPVAVEFELFGKALVYLCLVDITWRAVERFERRILTLAGIAHADRDLPQAFRALHHKVPTLRKDLLKLLAEPEA